MLGKDMAPAQGSGGAKVRGRSRRQLVFELYSDGGKHLKFSRKEGEMFERPAGGSKWVRQGAFERSAGPDN